MRMEEMQQLKQAAKETADQWHRRVMAAQDIGMGGEEEMMFCDDMLVDAADWLDACSWVCREAQAELDAGQPGQFCELSATLVEETAGGAVPEDLLVFVWAVVGEPPEMAAALYSGEDREEVDADEAEAEAVTEDADDGAVGAGADAEETAKEAEAEAATEVEAAAATQAVAEAEAAGVVEAAVVVEAEAAAAAEAEAEARLTWPRQEQEEGQEGTLHPVQLGGAVGAVVVIVEGALRWTRQGPDQEGTLHLARPGGAVVAVAYAPASKEDTSRAAAVEGTAAAVDLRKWRERKRLFDPGG